MDIQNAIQGFWLSRRRDLATNTQRDYALTFRRMIDYCGNVEFSDIDGKSLNLFLDHLVDEYGLGKKTLLNSWIALSALWSWAAVELKAPHVVREFVNRPKPQNTIIKPYTKEELKRLMDAFSSSEVQSPARRC